MVNSLDHISFPELAGRLDAFYSREEDAIHLGVLGQEYVVRHDGIFLLGQKAPETSVAVIIDYLFSSGTTSVVLPWRAIGAFSPPSPDFRKRVELPLAGFAAEIAGRAATLLAMLDAEATPSLVGSDMAITVRALPRVRLRVELFQESQDFPAEAWVLFSNNAYEFLSVPSMQLLAEMLKDRILSLLRIY